MDTRLTPQKGMQYQQRVLRIFSSLEYLREFVTTLTAAMTANWQGSRFWSANEGLGTA